MGTEPRLLVVEDDVHVLQGLVAGLSRAGFAVEVAQDGRTAAERAVGEPFDLVVLDLMLPGQSGFDVLAAMSGRVSVPVIVLTARTELDARLRSFQLGAVDYVAKPFFIEELLARIRSRLALRAETPHRVVEMGPVTVDLDAREALRDGSSVGLTGHEFNLLAWLVERPGRAVSRAQLAEHALGMENPESERTVDSHMSRLRRKLGPQGKWLQTVWGVGYRYRPGGA